jgi:hypothetical protein
MSDFNKRKDICTEIHKNGLFKHLIIKMGLNYRLIDHWNLNKYPKHFAG